MQTWTFLLVVAIVGACSVDHITVAALDDTSGGGAAGAAPAGGATAAGQAGAGGEVSASAGGVVGAGAAQAGGEAGRVTSPEGGSAESTAGAGPLNVAGEGSVAFVTRCSCLGQTWQFCGSDGVTYPDPVDCPEGETCLPPSVECWHACPCLPGEDGTGVTTSFSADCMSTAQCAEGIICMTFDNVSPDAETTCETTFE